MFISHKAQSMLTINIYDMHFSHIKNHNQNHFFALGLPAWRSGGGG